MQPSSIYTSPVVFTFQILLKIYESSKPAHVKMEQPLPFRIWHLNDEKVQSTYDSCELNPELCNDKKIVHIPQILT